jgi:DMSO/TMAO reductase YedYZ molybdopterin-dependent catalytic subunit
VQFTGIDGDTTSLPLEDALAGEVMLADRLDGEALSVDHGAPIRVVAPAHYGYKSAKHLRGVVILARAAHYGGRLSETSEHRRGRVALEERGSGKSGEELRAVYAAALESMLAYYRGLTHS